MPTNLVLPRNMKAFLFMTDDDPMDSKVEETIMFLAKRYGWKESYATHVETKMEYGNRGVAIVVRYYIPSEALK